MLTERSHNFTHWIYFGFSFLLSVHACIAQSSWAETKKSGKGSVIVYWDESKPFIFKNDAGQMTGIEGEIMSGFQDYIKNIYHVDVTVKWIEAKSFNNTYLTIRDDKQNGIFGTSAFSITPARQLEVDFSPPYMPDISVLITNKNVPIVTSLEDFNKVFSKLTAITIKQTTYEHDLLRMKQQGHLPFNIQYIPSHENILRTIEKTEDSFGFIDLPVYMMLFNNDPSINVKRQNLFSIKREGYAFIYPKNSDWDVVIHDYFNNPKFKSELQKIIGHYIDIELFHFIENLAIQSNEQVSLLTKEKEIQQKNITEKANQIQQEARTRNFLIVFTFIVFICLVIIIMMYQKQNEQREKIEAQGKNIALKSEQLEKRNENLIALNEEKNNLVKILAHDLRTPINHMQGLAQLLLINNHHLPEDQKMLIQQITDASLRLNKMISNILDIDAIESNRTKIFIDNVAIGPLVRQIVKTFETQAAKKNISLYYSSTCDDCLIKGDSLFLTQIFENLISNAIKFSKKEKKVLVKVEDVNEYINIHVIDNGPGLTSEDLKILFKKFQRLSAKATGGEVSTGLGLSIVKRYVELMNGKVWCESIPEKETSFIVSFEKLH